MAADRNRRLADSHHVHVTLEQAEHVLQRRDIIVEIERAGELRHHPRIDPIRDVDLVIGQQRLDRAAQQRGKVPGHWRHEQDRGIAALLARRQLAAEMDKPAERVAPDDLLAHLHGGAAHGGFGDPKAGLVVAAGGALEHLAGGSGAATDRRMGQRVERIIEELPARASSDTDRADGGVAEFEPMIQHV